MSGRAKLLRKPEIAHVIRAVAAITGRKSFVIIGTSAVIAQLRSVPLDLMGTREVDIYADDGGDLEETSTLIDGTLGEGSPFDETFGYYAHGVGDRTACLPEDWQKRAVSLKPPGFLGVACLCPDTNDIALSKVCAWREKDRTWLTAGVRTGILNLALMKARVPLIKNSNAPDGAEIARRIAWVEAAAALRASGPETA